MPIKKMRSPQTEEEAFWPSFTDVMSSIVFILFFFIMLMFIKQLVSARSYDAKLTAANQDLTLKQGQLEDVNQSLSSASAQLQQRKAEIAAMEGSLSDRENQIASLQARLDQEQAALLAREAELDQVRTQLQEISVLRLSILNEVKKSIEAELGTILQTGSEPLVEIDDKANLVINSQLLFAKGSSEISESGYRLLEKFAYAFERVLRDDYVRSYIDSIVISGYADSDDSYENNYTLSCERATAVICALMQKNPTLENTYGSYFQASGFSEFRPAVLGDGEASKSKNRRIQISINIKDSNLQKIINDYMNTP
jgi:chemotaxis protein MotB